MTDKKIVSELLAQALEKARSLDDFKIDKARLAEDLSAFIFNLMGASTGNGITEAGRNRLLAEVNAATDPAQLADLMDKAHDAAEAAKKQSAVEDLFKTLAPLFLHVMKTAALK